MVNYHWDPLSVALSSQDSENYSHVLFILSNLIVSNIKLQFSVRR